MLYSESCIPTSHNSFSSSSNGFILWPQQHLSIKDQLKIGVRGFMLDIYYVDGDIVLRHTSKSIPGVTKPLSGKDILFYDTFKEFIDFLDKKSTKEADCSTIAILLESYVFNKKTYEIINKEGLADKYLYTMNPNSASLADVCNKIVLFTSHSRDMAPGVHSPSLYKENDYKYYSDEFLGYSTLNFLEYEKCEERAEGRAKYINPDIKIFCFNHFSSLSALLTLNICIKPILHQLTEVVDQNLELLNIDCESRLAKFNFLKPIDYAKKSFLHSHLDQCKSQDIKDKFHPTLIAVDFIEKDSDVFLCYKDENCFGAKCDFIEEEITYDLYSIIGTGIITLAAALPIGRCCHFGNDQHDHID
jgi:hypothetical protein